MQLPDAFDAFYNKIALGAKPRERIESAVESLSGHLTKAYGLSPSDVFTQGSYPNETAIEPATKDGEYDVDLIAVCAEPSESADSSLNNLEARLSENATYAEMIKKEGSRKKPCVRLRYADDDIGGFHVDIVPTRASTSADQEAPLEAPRRGDGWHDTAPAEFTDWARSRGERFARTVMMLKRWRAECQSDTHSIKSIVLQVLVADCLGSASSDGEAIVQTLSNMQTLLEGSPTSPPRIANPVLQAEDLAARWTDAAYKDFLKQLSDAANLAQRALSSDEVAESHDLWRGLLGDDFPRAPTEPTRRVRKPPATPAPGFEKIVQEPPRNERYG